MRSPKIENVEEDSPCPKCPRAQQGLGRYVFNVVTCILVNIRSGVRVKEENVKIPSKQVVISLTVY